MERRKALHSRQKDSPSAEITLVRQRDALYGLFLDCLKQPEKKKALSLFAAQFAPDSYAALKAPRYLNVLKSWRPTGNSPDDELALSERLFNAGLYFDAHEYLESIWKKSTGPWKRCFQGIIQVAAAFHKMELDPGKPAGALYLLERGQQKIKESSALLGQATVDEIEARLKPAAAALARGRLEPPKLRWSAGETTAKGAGSGK